MVRSRETAPITRRDVRHGRTGATTGRSTPRALELQRRIGNRSVAKLMRALWTRPRIDAESPERRRVTAELAGVLQPNAPLFNDIDTTFYFVSTFSNTEILVKARNTVYIYDLDKDHVVKYMPGDPVTMVMQNPRELRGDQVAGSPERHTGLNFEMVLLDSDGRELETPGVAIIEVVHTVSATGWCAGAPAVVQTSPLSWRKDARLTDSLSISTQTVPAPTAPLPGLAAAASPPPSSSSPAATTASEGEFVGFQYFVYLAADGAPRPIPRSGFRITKQMEGGKVIVTRTPAAGEGVKAGTGSATATIKFA